MPVGQEHVLKQKVPLLWKELSKEVCFLLKLMVTKNCGTQIIM
jgi:hypothetical protein